MTLIFCQYILNLKSLIVIPHLIQYCFLCFNLQINFQMNEFVYFSILNFKSPLSRLRFVNCQVKNYSTFSNLLMLFQVCLPKIIRIKLLFCKFDFFLTNIVNDMDRSLRLHLYKKVLLFDPLI